MWAERGHVSDGALAQISGGRSHDNIVVTLDNGSTTPCASKTSTSAPIFRSAPSCLGRARRFTAARRRLAPRISWDATITQAPFGNLLQFNVPLLQDSDDLGGTASRVYYAVRRQRGRAGWAAGLQFARWRELVAGQSDGAGRELGSHGERAGDASSVFATDYVSQLVVTFIARQRRSFVLLFLDLMNGVNPGAGGRRNHPVRHGHRQ